MRRGRIFKRCGRCGAMVKDRRCPRCQYDSFSWGFTVDVAAEGATRKQKTKHGFRTKDEALVAMTELQAGLHDGTYVPQSRMMLATYLEREWLPIARERVRAGTYDAYELHVKSYIVPRLGDALLQQLSRGQIKKLYADLRQSGRKRGEGGLSPKTVHNVHLTLRKALGDAVADGLISRNPADAAHKLPPTKPEMKTWTAEELRAFLAHVRDDDLYAAWRVAATTGLRRGEVIGLRWKDLNLEVGQMSVSQQRVKAGGTVVYGRPKTAKGRRVVALDPTTIAAIRAHRTAQLEQRLLFGAGYQDEGLVFCLPTGAPIDPDGFSQRFQRQVRDSGLPVIRLHDLRHTHATLALLAGVHPKVVQERLGHSSISVTLDTYSHAIPAMQADAAAKVAAMVDGL